MYPLYLQFFISIHTTSRYSLFINHFGIISRMYTQVDLSDLYIFAIIIIFKLFDIFW